MPGGVCLRLYLLAGVGLLTGAMPLQLQGPEAWSSEKATQRPNLTRSKFMGQDTLSRPGPVPVISISPTATAGGLSQSTKPANHMQWIPTDSHTPLMAVHEHSFSNPASEVEGITVGYIEQPGGAKESRASIKEELLGGHLRSEEDSTQDGQLLKLSGADRHSPAPGTNLGLANGSSEGIHQELLPEGDQKTIVSESRSANGSSHSFTFAQDKDKEIEHISAATFLLQTFRGARQMTPESESHQDSISTQHNPVPVSGVQQGSVTLGGPPDVQMFSLGSDGPAGGLYTSGDVGQVGSPWTASDLSRGPEGQLAKPKQINEGGSDEVQTRPEEIAAKHQVALPLGITAVGLRTKMATTQSMPGEEPGPGHTAGLDEVLRSSRHGTVLKEKQAIPSPTFASTYPSADPIPGQSSTGQAVASLVSPDQQNGRVPQPPQTGMLLAQNEVTTVSILGASALVEKSGTEAMAGREPGNSQGVSLIRDKDPQLIFKPWHDGLTEGAGTVQTSSSPQPTSSVAGLEPVGATTRGADHSSLKTPPPVPQEGAFTPWQMSGTEMSDTFRPSVLPPLTAPPPGPPLDYSSEEFDMIESPTGDAEALPTETKATISTEGSFLTTAAKATSLSSPRNKSGLEELESEEEHDDEDEEDEDTEESEEEDSQEDMTDTPTPTTAPHTYSHVPYHIYSNSIWVQRHQGLVRSWVEKIRDKAGYVSGMLAPVGIGIAGALFILGALYSIKVVHRKRRTSFKHQRRKRTEMNSRQDRVMLLADSSEDEF